MPVGLIVAAVGGSPIEYWIPPSDPKNVNINPCEDDTHQCDNSGGKMDSTFWSGMVEPMAPYTLSAVVWDQAERDTKCPLAMSVYPCLQKYLISGWQKAFNSSFAFVGVQLAGYTAAYINGTGDFANMSVTGEDVFTMRLQQEQGCKGVQRCTLVPTYDMSCQAGLDGGCPFGSVHQPHKPQIGARVGLQLWKHLVSLPTTEVLAGPVAQAARIVKRNGNSYSIQVDFAGGTAPFKLAGTRNCTTVAGFCCDGSANNGHTVDFDVSSDGGSYWVNGTAPVVNSATGSITFEATMPPSMSGGGGGSSTVRMRISQPPTMLRMTAASIWPQCTLYNSEGFPAFPFALEIATL